MNRRYDAALLFLVHPLGVVTGSVANQIVGDVQRVLAGPYGIRRYLGDSYWAPDYDLRVAPAERTRDYSDDPWARDALLERPGDEAQWCLFDPVLAAHFGARYQKTRDRSDLEQQLHCFERSLAQITQDWRCPELYYLRNGAYVPGPHTPLLWTVANLSVAPASMKNSAALAG